MSDARGHLRAVSDHLRIRPVSYDHPDAAALVERVQEFYVERYGGRDDDPTRASDFEPPTGVFFVGYLADEPVVTGAWRIVEGERLGRTRLAEIKRMYVVPELQRRGLARRMLAHLEATAAAAGIDALVLSTAVKQPEAIELYESAGYERVEGFGHYAGQPLNRCYGKRLDGC